MLLTLAPDLLSHTHAQLEDARKGSKEGSRERNEKIAAARSKIEVKLPHNLLPPLLTALPPSLSQSLEREVKELEVSLHTLQSERQQLAEDDQEMIRQRAKLEFDVKDLEESLVDDKKSKVLYLCEHNTVGIVTTYIVLWRLFRP